MKDFFARLSERERLLLSLAGFVLLVVLVYSLLWRPFGQRVERLNQRVEQQQSLLAWMQESALKVQQLRHQSGPQRGVLQQSLLSVVDQTIRRSGLSQSLKRVEPDGADKVKVRLEQAGFDDMVKWLESLQRINGVTVQSITIDRLDNVGVVNARLTLVGGQS